MADPIDFTRIDAAGSPVFSCDGTRLFHLRGAGLQQVWVVGVDGTGARQLTAHDEKVGLLRRAPKDDRLVYSIDVGGDERHQLWLLEDGVSRALTDAPGVIHGMGAWSADGGRISFTANDRDAGHFDVLEMEVGSGAVRRLAEGVHEAVAGGWSAGGKLLATLDRNSGDQRPGVVEAGVLVPVPREGAARFGSLRWDGEGLLGLTDSGRDWMGLARVEPASGAVVFEHAPEGREVEAWALSSTGLLATVENDGGFSLLRVGPRGGERGVVEGVPAVAGELSWSADGESLAFAGSGAEAPAGLFVWRDGVVRAVWRPACTLVFRPFALVGWVGHDGREVPGWLAYPAGEAPAGGWPAVIWVHGGPASQARPGFRADMQSLLSQGYAVLMPNVRGSTGYGRAAMESDDVERRLDAVHDLAAGRHFLARQEGIDPERIAVMGQSYGGYMVLAAITEYPGSFRCAIDFYGIGDFGTLLEATGPWRRAHRAAEYGDPVRHRALFDRISPIRHMGRAAVPLLVLHGERDPRVPIGESERVVAAQRGLGRTVAYEVFDHAGHGFVRAADKARVYRAVAGFLAEHL